METVPDRPLGSNELIKNLPPLPGDGQGLGMSGDVATRPLSTPTPHESRVRFQVPADAAAEQDGETVDDMDSSKILEQFADEELFPGFNFEDESTEALYAIEQLADTQQTSQELKNPLDSLDSKHRKEEEQRILNKYTQYGAISMFKGRDEMRNFKAKLSAKNEINRILNLVSAKEDELNRLEDLLSETRENRSQCKMEIDQIIKELTQIIDNTLPTKHGQKLLELYKHQKKVTLPTDPPLMLNKRYRLLLDHFYQHEKTLDETSRAIPALETALGPLRRELSVLHAKEWELKPLRKKLMEADLQEFSELQVIAKYRALDAQKKRKAIMKHAEHLKNEHIKACDEESKKRQQNLEAMVQRNSQMEKRYLQTIADIENQKSQIEKAHKEAEEKKQRELAKLAKHIEYSKQKSKTGASSNSHQVALNVDDIGDANETIQAVKRHIAEKELSTRLLKEKKQKQKEKNSMEILKRIIEEEGIRVKKSKLPRRRSQAPAARTKTPIILEPISHGASPDTQFFEPTKNTADSNLTATPLQDLQEDELPKRKQLPPPNMKNYKPVNDKISDLPHGGSPFLVSPDKFIFEDYDSDQVYVQKAVITNISGRINSFKLLPVAIEISNFFEVQFLPPGKMSAGVQQEISVIFRPPPGFARDILPTKIDFASDIGGCFSIDVSCKTRKCLPVVAAIGGEGVKMIKFAQKSPSHHEQLARDIDIYRLVGQIPRSSQKPVARTLDDGSYSLNFGTVCVGGRTSLYLDLCNLGATEVGFKILSKDDWDRDQAAIQAEKDRMMQLQMNGSSISIDNQENPDISKTFVEVAPTAPNPDALAFTFRKNHGVLKSYDSQLLHIDFKPPYRTAPKPDADQVNVTDLKVAQKSFVIQFDKQEVGPIFIHCDALVSDAPIFVERDVLDFNMCIAGQVYQNKMVVRNHHNIALKFWLEFPNLTMVSQDEVDEVVVPNLGKVSISPAVAFIQPFEPFYVWFTIIPSTEACEMHQNGEIPFNVPFFIKYVDEAVGAERAIPMTISGRITNNDVVLKPSDGSNTLDFGVCSTEEIKELPIVIQNASRLAQTVRFVKGNSVFSLLDLDGTFSSEVVLSLGPLQSVNGIVRFVPTQEAQYGLNLICQTTWSRTFELPCRGIGVNPLARFEHCHLRFPPCAFGSQKSLRCRILRQELYDHIIRTKDKKGIDPLPKNNASGFADNITFEFGSPVVISVHDSIKTYQDEKLMEKDLMSYVLTDKDPEMINIWPKSGVLGSGELASIELTLNTPKKAPKPEKSRSIDAPVTIDTSTTVSAETSKSKTAPSAKGKSIPVKPTLEKAPVEPEPLEDVPDAPHVELTAFHQQINEMNESLITFLIPCHLKKTVSEQSRLKALISAVSVTTPSTESKNAGNDFHERNEIEKSASLIYLRVTVPLVSPDIMILQPSEGKINFEKIPIGQKSVKTIMLKNVSHAPVSISCNGLNPLGPFYLVKAIRRIAPGEIVPVKISFEPEDTIKFSSVLELATDTTKTKIRMIGEGASPSISIECVDDPLSFGDVSVGDSAVKTFKICNTSDMPINCSLRLSRIKSNGLHTEDGQQTKTHGTINFSGMNAFSVSPLRVLIESGLSQEITVKFTPDRESDLFFDHISISYWGQKIPCKIKVHGRGWESTGVVQGYDHHPDEYSESAWIQSNRLELENSYKKLEGESGPCLNPSVNFMEELVKAGDGMLNDILAGTSRRDMRFITISLPWKEVADEDERKVWTIGLRDIVLSNLKPLFKLELGKKSPVIDFSIEKFDGSFYFDQELKEYVICQSPIAKEDVRVSLSLEPTKGTIDLGGSKTLKIIINDPILRFWKNMSKTCKRLEKQFSASITTKSTIEIGNSRVALKDSKSRGKSQALKAVDAGAVVSDMLEERNFFNMEDDRTLEPHYVESVFKITVKGGYRLVEPKGPVPPQESRVWLLKLHTV